MDVSTNRVTEHLCSRSENGPAEPIVRGTSVHLIGSTLLIVQLEPLSGDANRAAAIAKSSGVESRQRAKVPASGNR